ncbi:MAG: thioredoxin family protein [Bacteroidetes bacterium]|nr:MAG: thioredoxin family protein [Bacteroidota bacterium]
MKELAILFLAIFSHFIGFSQVIKEFSLPDVVDGSTFSLSEAKGEKAIVLIFYSSKCAYGDYYLDRIFSLKNEFSSKGVKFILINSNSSDFVAEESIEEMKKFAVKHSLNIPYLADKEKQVKNMLKATRTPEVFVLKPTQEKFNVFYKGAIDDNPQSASDVSHAYLKEAILILLNNKAPKLNQTRPVGCLIK